MVAVSLVSSNGIDTTGKVPTILNARYRCVHGIAALGAANMII
jgi:hypothetical protein